MFEEALGILEEDLDFLSTGFRLKETDERIASLLWVDNCFLLAHEWGESSLMVRGFTAVLHDRFKWTWKPSSLELLFEKVVHPHGDYIVDTTAG